MLRLICAFVLCLWAVDAPACDLCGCYTPQLETMHAREVGAMAGEDFLRGWYAGIAEQFTHFGTLQFNGREVANPAAQFLDSSVTQLVAGYSVTPHFAIQLNVPFIYREFRRPEAFRTNDGDIGGLGDASLLAKIVLWHHEWTPLREFDVNGKNPVAIDHDPDFTASLIGLLGVKFPTGATTRLKEEFHETQTPGAPESGIHGHDLTLGSGSYDAVFGGQTSLRYKSCFAEADAQFTWRSEGAHDYRFANDVSWSGGPGVYECRGGGAMLWWDANVRSAASTRMWTRFATRRRRIRA